jgi:histidyl-tRNA synthetase
VIAQYPNEIKLPFKRYQVGKVWRGEKPQAGRFREFVQFDADIVGSAKMSADAEIISLMYETMTRLGISEFLIRVNNRFDISYYGMSC